VAVAIRQVGPQLWEQAVAVGAATPEVFRYLADFERHREWELELQDVRLSHGRPGESGAEYLKTYGERPTGLLRRMFSSPLRVTCQLTAVDPSAGRLAWKQHVSHRTSGPASFQNIDVVVTPSDAGSQVVVRRELVGTDGMSVDLVSRFSAGLGDRLQAMPPETAEAVGRMIGGGRQEDLTRRALDGHPSRGPGPTSLDRLQAILAQ
jgi:polyketide cyclase/dehydrase/lipid transport protein